LPALLIHLSINYTRENRMGTNYLRLAQETGWGKVDYQGNKSPSRGEDVVAGAVGEPEVRRRISKCKGDRGTASGYELKYQVPSDSEWLRRSAGRVGIGTLLSGEEATRRAQRE
jgi:hypothetical protein